MYFIHEFIYIIISFRSILFLKINISQRSSSHGRCNEREQPKEMDKKGAEQCLRSMSTLQSDSVEQYGDISSGRDSLDSAEISQQTRTENPRVNSPAVEDEQNREMLSLNKCKSAHKETIFCNDHDNEKAVSLKESFTKDFENPYGILNSENTGSISDACCSPDRAEFLLQDTDGQKEVDALSCLSRDGYSTEGTAGSGSFGDRDKDIINRLLVDNIDEVGTDDGNFDEVPSGRKSSLTPLSLEALNCNELDRRECVRSYIQAWSPLNLPNAGTYSNSLPGACTDIGPIEQTSSESYDRFPSLYEDSPDSPNKPRELHEVDSQEFSLFYQRELEPVSRPLLDTWNLLKNDRAPWISFRSAGSNELIQGRGGPIDDDQDSSWPKAKADCWQDPTKGLTICSLSTINEETDDVDRTDRS